MNTNAACDWNDFEQRIEDRSVNCIKPRILLKTLGEGDQSKWRCNKDHAVLNIRDSNEGAPIEKKSKLMGLQTAKVKWRVCRNKGDTLDNVNKHG